MEKQVEKLNKTFLQSIKNNFPIGLAQGKMGLSIYFYLLYKNEHNNDSKAIAEQLLEEVLEKLSLDSTIDVESGLAGIELGITYLIKNKFVEGDVNDLLEEIDNVIFKNLAFLQPNSSYPKEELLHLLFYIYIRLMDQKEETSQYIFRELIIKILNIFVTELKDEFFNESFCFSVYSYHLPLFTYICACLLKLDFYNVRIYKILEEFEPKIISRFPILHANRLYLLCGIIPLLPYMSSEWKSYAELLRKEINLQIIFDKEMKNKHIFISNGLSMVYLLLYYLEKNYPKFKIDYSPQEFYDRISISEAWEALLEHAYYWNIHRGLLNGFPGVQLTLSHIKNNTYED